jgi:hypothetical protein
MQELDCYTDASYAKDVGGSFIAYKMGDFPIWLQYLEGVKNTQAEVFSARQCVRVARALHPNHVINVYTDCQAVIRKEPRQKNVNFFKVEGHPKTKQKDERQQVFSQVDRTARKALREMRKEKAAALKEGAQLGIQGQSGIYDAKASATKTKWSETI